MNILIYLTKTVFISGLLSGYYLLLLHNRFFHNFNRFYLLAIPLLSFMLPALQLHLPGFWNQASPGSAVRLLGVGRGTLEEAVTVYANRNPVTWFSQQSFLVFLWAALTALFLIRFFRSVRYLLNLRKNKALLPLPGASLYFVREAGTPFSFFKSIFWDQDTDIDTPSSRQMLRHELFHVKHHHSLDIVLMESFSILCWFNPFSHYLKKEIKAIHEYAADRYAAGESSSFAYASLLLSRISGSPVPLTNPFFKNQIKRRIAMITQINQNRKTLTGRILILPLILVLAGIFSFKMQPPLFPSGKKIRVVIDAGHGGNFTGATVNGLQEKNINLGIAKKIQALSADYNIEVIMSRESDITPGSNELHASLEYIAALPKNKNADCFISIHTNATETAEQGKQQHGLSGFQIYIPRNSSEVYEGSLKFGSIISETIRADYQIEPELKQVPGDGSNIFILKNATVPALLIECGYMDNPSDRLYLQDEKSREKIARDILEGIRKYSAANTRYEAGPVPAAGAAPVMAPLTESLDNPSDSTGPYTKVEVEASYPGGPAGWSAYLMKTLTYPEEAQNKEVQGDVIVEFIVNEDGSLSGVHAISGPKSLRAESIRVVAQSGRWIPAKDKGKIVASVVKQPIKYRLSVK